MKLLCGDIKYSLWGNKSVIVPWGNFGADDRTMENKNHYFFFKYINEPCNCRKGYWLAKDEGGMLVKWIMELKKYVERR